MVCMKTKESHKHFRMGTGFKGGRVCCRDVAGRQEDRETGRER